MASGKKYGVLGLLLLLLLAGAGAYFYATTRQADRKPPPVITFSGKQLEVLRYQGPRSVDLPDGALGINDRLITHEFGADVMCTDGSRLHLGPLTDIHIELDPNGGQRMIITMGAMRIETTASAMGMIIGAPFGVIHLKAGEVTTLDISVSQGAFVRVGQVEVERNQSFVKVPQGFQYTIDGLVLPLNPNDGITLQEIILDLVKPQEAKRKAIALSPMSLVLYPKPGTQFAQQTRELRPPRHPQALAQNDRVHTTSPGAYIVADGWGRYTLDEATDLMVLRSGQQKRKHEAVVGLELAGGGFTLLAQTKDASTFTTWATMGEQAVQLDYGLVMTNAHVEKDGDGGRVKLRFGRLLVGERAVEAGSVAVFTGKDVREEPLTAAYVDVSKDMTSIVHYPNQVPAVNFVWSPTPTQKTMNIEISREPGFLDVPFAESIQRGSFMVDQLSGNKAYYWRVGGSDAPVQLLQLESDTPACTSCIPPDVVSDAVPHTVIEYDETVAQVAFEWRPFVGAKYYLFRLYADGQFEKPIVAHHSDQPNYLLPATHLEPGAYYWNALALDGEGRLLHKGALSDFEIQEPDQMPPLSIKTPTDGAVVNAPSLTTEGQTRRRSKLTCNGASITADSSGHFSHGIPLHHGINFLVYTVETNKRTQHLYIRQVTRP